LLCAPLTADYYDGSRLGYLTAQIYPDAVRERLLMVTEWFGTWTVFDDQLEQLPDRVDPSAVDTVAAAMLTWLSPARTDPGNPFADAFGQAWARMREHSSPAWQDRFQEHTRQYLAGCRWEADNRHRAAVPDLESYMLARRRFGGIRMAMDLAEFGGGYELDARVHADPHVQELLDLLGDITLWGNDLFSQRVDGEEGNVSNLVFVLQREHGCGPARAAGLALDMIDERVRRLVDLQDRLPDWCSVRGLDAGQRTALDRYAAGMRTWISGNVTWSLANSRYETAQHRVCGEQPNFLLAALPARPAVTADGQRAAS
jgi:hypothetical protein